jgi:hypothetical protein
MGRDEILISTLLPIESDCWRRSSTSDTILDAASGSRHLVRSQSAPSGGGQSDSGLAVISPIEEV